MQMLSLQSCKFGDLSDDSNKLCNIVPNISSLRLILIHGKLLYVGSFQVCLSDFDGKNSKWMKHILVLVHLIYLNINCL